MKVLTETKNDVLIITPQERHLDSSISSEFREKIRDLVQQGNTRIIINLSAVDFIDSSGLGVLVLGHKEVRKKGELKIAAANAQINNLMSLVRLDQVLNIYSNEQEALDSFN